MIPHLSSCKSPQQMMGATVKNHFAQQAGISLDDLYVVSIVPCLAKKYEAARPEFAPEGIRDVDAVLTTTEFLEMVKMLRLEPADIAPATFDAPYARVSGAGVLFGASGGVAEAALRMAVEKLTGERLVERLDFHEVRGFEGVKEASITAGETTVRVAVISGLNNAEPLVKRIVAGEDVGYDLVEVMACPGGCINGAGHPVPDRVGEMAARQKVLVNIDRASDLPQVPGQPGHPAPLRRVLRRAQLRDRASPAAHDLRPVPAGDGRRCRAKGVRRVGRVRVAVSVATALLATLLAGCAGPTTAPASGAEASGGQSASASVGLRRAVGPDDDPHRLAQGPDDDGPRRAHERRREGPGRAGLPGHDLRHARRDRAQDRPGRARHRADPGEPRRRPLQPDERGGRARSRSWRSTPSACSRSSRPATPSTRSPTSRAARSTAPARAPRPSTCSTTS